MRLWSLHPRYLDAKGLVALWREGLLARKVLRGETKGYRHHPQLIRFRGHPEPLLAIDIYLAEVCDEAEKRGYRFERSKISPPISLSPKITVTTGQIQYEWHHLQEKLKTREPIRFASQSSIAKPDIHPLFLALPGDVEGWEIVSSQ